MTTKLPAVKTVKRNDNETLCIFENGAQLLYEWADGGKVYEKIYAPSDPHSAMERTYIQTESEDKTDEYMDTALDVYDDYETVEELQQDWSTLAEWVTHE